jgi:hypothetical protein
MGYPFSFFSQILQSMAFGVSQLHQCGILHNNIATNYFKVMRGLFCLFPLSFLCQLPSPHNLLKLASDFPDIRVAGAAPQGEACQLEKRQSR